MRIDIHNHVIPERALDVLQSVGAFQFKVVGGIVHSPVHVPYPLKPSFYDPAAKLVELDNNQIDAAVLTLSPSVLYYEAGPDACDALCDAVNRGLAEYQALNGSRFRWMAHVPMATPERAVSVLERAAAGGCVGVQIGSSVAGAHLDEAAYEPFWLAVERLRLPVFIHPFYNAHHPGMTAYHLQNVIGNMLETTIAFERLICAGVLDRHPDLQVLLPHGGGYFPYQAGRLRHAITVRPELAGQDADPWRFGGRVKFDTMLHDGPALRYLVGRVGVENVLMGTDLPFDMAMTNPVAQLEAWFDVDTVTRLAGGNAAQLFHFES